MICPTCLRPRATEADNITWDKLDRGEIDLPDDWTDEDGDHLCWSEIGGVCDPPDWFAAVTPLEVRDLRAQIAETRSALDNPDRHPDHPVGALAIELREARDEVRLLRAQLADEEARAGAYLARLAELTNGQPDPLIMAAATTTARLRATIAEMTPRWRTGEPPAEAQVWLEGANTFYRVEVIQPPAEDAGVYVYPQPDGAGYPWEGERWCPINKPETS